MPLNENEGLGSSRWFYRPSPNRSCSLRLFCIPHAGAGASIFRKWPHQLPRHVEVCGIQLPGREARFEEPPHTELFGLVEALAKAVGPYTNVPFALFGHSMGALIAFALAHELRRSHLPQPVQLMVSGRRAPQLPNNDPPIHDLPEEQFLRRISELNGTGGGVLQNEELMELLSPVLRADFKVCETYNSEPVEPLNCPISAFGGLQDTEVNQNEMAAWRQQTRRGFVLKMFSGDHFYLHADPLSFLKALSLQLEQILMGIDGFENGPTSGSTAV